MNIIVKIQAGLGNQMFQYAYAVKIASLYKDSTIYLDTTYYQKKHIRSLELNNYNLAKNVQWINKIPKWLRFINRNYNVTDKIYYKICKKHIKCPKFLSQRGYWFEWNNFTIPTLKKEIQNIYMFGFFENEKEISPIYNQLTKDFTLKNDLSEQATELLQKIRETSNSVGISIRIGEERIKSGYPICSKEFYLAALTELEKFFPIQKIFVSSDCIDKLIEGNWFKQYDTTFIQNLNPAESLEVLRNCNHFIISNTTFGWWAAYLGQYPNKKIIAPTRFYKEKNSKLFNSKIALKNAIYLDNETGQKKKL